MSSKNEDGIVLKFLFDFFPVVKYSFNNGNGRANKNSMDKNKTMHRKIVEAFWCNLEIAAGLPGLCKRGGKLYGGQRMGIYPITPIATRYMYQAYFYEQQFSSFFLLKRKIVHIYSSNCWETLSKHFANRHLSVKMFSHTNRLCYSVELSQNLWSLIFGSACENGIILNLISTQFSTRTKAL